MAARAASTEPMGAGASAALATSIRATSYDDLAKVLAQVGDAERKKILSALTTETHITQFVKMPGDPQHWGMTIQQIFDFGVEVFGSSKAIIEIGNEVVIAGQTGQNMRDMSGPRGLSMYDVVTQYVKPKTKVANLSLAVFMNQDAPLRATVFLSHSWAEKFAYFVLALCGSCFSDASFEDLGVSREQVIPIFETLLGWTDGYPSPDTVIWVCAFAINQNANIQGELGTTILESPFAKVLLASQRVIVLFNLSMDLYTRVWCVLEGYLAAKKLNDDPTFTILPVGIQGAGQAFDKRWITDNFPDEYVVVKQLLDEKQLQIKRGEKPDLNVEQVTAWAKKYVAENPLYVKDAQASVQKDREDIMNVIRPMMDEVDQLVQEMRIKKMSANVMQIMNAGN